MNEQIVVVLAIVVIFALVALVTKFDPAFKKPWALSPFDPKWNEEDA